MQSEHVNGTLIDQSGSTKWYPPAPDHPLIFPTFLLYPAASTSDIITKFHELATFGDQLEAMFPINPSSAGPGWAEWDQGREYYVENLMVYAETHGKRLLKVGKTLTLRDVIDKAAALPSDGDAKDGIVMRDGLMSFFVLPKGPKETAWVERYKQTRK